MIKNKSFVGAHCNVPLGARSSVPLHETHHRRSIRLKGYDYSQPGAYFLTICTHNNGLIFGDVFDGNMHLNEFGKIVEKEWLKTFDMRKNLKLDGYVIMPNHFHSIIVIFDGRGTLQCAHAEMMKCRGTLQCALGGTQQRSPTNNQWRCLEEKIYGKMKQ